MTIDTALAGKYEALAGELAAADAKLTRDLKDLLAEAAALGRRAELFEASRAELVCRAFEVHWAGQTAGVRVQGQPDDIPPLARRADVPPSLVAGLLTALREIARHGQGEMNG